MSFTINRQRIISDNYLIGTHPIIAHSATYPTNPPFAFKRDVALHAQIRYPPHPVSFEDKRAGIHMCMRSERRVSFHSQIHVFLAVPTSTVNKYSRISTVGPAFFLGLADIFQINKLRAKHHQDKKQTVFGTTEVLTFKP